MSEYISCETVFADKDSLIDALVDCGIAKSHIEVHEDAKPLVGYQNDRRVQKANIIIRKQHVGGASNDIGFEKGPDGKYNAWVSEYDRNHGLGLKITSKKIAQYYAKHTIIKKAKVTHGHKVHVCEEKNGKIKIKIRVS